MTKVAPGLGLSDRGLAKVCESRNIPVPPRGYWAKLAHGHKVTRPALPPWSGSGDGNIYFYKPPGQPKAKEPRAAEIEFEYQSANRIVVPEDSKKLHPMVRKTRQALQTAKPGDRGLLHPPPGCLDVLVARATLPRALRIMHALVTALEQRGYAVAVDSTKRITTASVLGENIGFRLLERAKQVTAKPTDYRWKYLKEGWGQNEPMDLVPSGLFVLEIGSGYRTPAIDERKGGPLEGRLNDFIVKLVKEALKERRWKEERERAEAIRREQERLRAIEEEKRRAEEKKIQQWDAWMTSWRRAKDVRIFARAIRRKFGPTISKDVTGWLAWAEEYAVRIDPLNTSPRDPVKPAAD